MLKFSKMDKKILIGSIVTGVLATGTLYSTTPEEKAEASTENQESVHTVIKGDTLWRISLNNNTSLSQLMAKNGLTGDLIHPGDKLSIPKEKEVVEAPEANLVYGIELTPEQ